MGFYSIDDDLEPPCDDEETKGIEFFIFLIILTSCVYCLCVNRDNRFLFL